MWIWSHFHNFAQEKKQAQNYSNQIVDLLEYTLFSAHKSITKLVELQNNEITK